jgi:chloramphenicol O-acetyltransferase type A
MKIIDIENWKRQEHYHFFSSMDSPYFGITAEVDCTNTYQKSKEEGHSFFASFFHKSMIAINSVEEFGYRIVEDQVISYPVIDAGTTISREDGTFGFVYVNFNHDFEIFNAELQAEIKAVYNSTGLRLNNEDLKISLIRHSSVPWTSFTSILHPTNFNTKDSVPKIVFGKFSERDGKKYLPVSIEAHHGLMDGLHIAQYLAEFQRQLDIN